MFVEPPGLGMVPCRTSALGSLLPMRASSPPPVGTSLNPLVSVRASPRAFGGNGWTTTGESPSGSPHER